MHHTTASLDSTIQHFLQAGTGVSAHYIVDRSGLLYQMVQESDTAYHAGDFPINLRSIGIEHVGGPDYNGFTDEQYAVSSDLCAEISERYGFEVSAATVVPHRDIVPTQCPGVLDVARIIEGGSSLSQAEIDAIITAVNAHTDAKFAEFYGADAATKRRMMRGADPYLPGHDTPIKAGDKINQTDAV